MALNCLHFDGAEHGAVTEAQNGGSILVTGATVTLDTTAARQHRWGGTYGGSYVYAVNCVLNTHYLQFQGWGTTGRHVNAWLYFRDANDRHIVIVDGSTVHLTVVWASDGSLVLRRGNSS